MSNANIPKETPPSEWCDDEIDLRELAMTLWQGKWIILLVSVGLAAVAGLVSLRLPKQYQAEASLLLTSPKIQIKAQDGIDFIAGKADVETARALAQSTEVFQALASDEDIQAAWQGEEPPLTWEILADKAKVEDAGKQSLRLVFRDTDPQRAALVVNRWAEKASQRINTQYGFRVVLEQIASKVKEAHQDYQEAEAAYVEATAHDRRAVLEAQLKQTETDFKCVLTRQSDIHRLQTDLQVFADYLKSLPADETLTPGDAMALATLQQRALATKVCMADTPSLQAQWQTADLTTVTVAKAAAFAENAQTVLQEQLSDLTTRKTAIEEQMMRLQTELEKEQTRFQEIMQQRDVAQKAYQSLIEAQSRGRALVMEGNDVAMIASRAVPPRTPSSPRVLMNTALAGVVGMMFSSLAVLVRAWWRAEESTKE